MRLCLKERKEAGREEIVNLRSAPPAVLPTGTRTENIQVPRNSPGTAFAGGAGGPKGSASKIMSVEELPNPPKQLG